MVKNYLWVFVNSMITNPTFDSQVIQCWVASAQSSSLLVFSQHVKSLLDMLDPGQHTLWVSILALICQASHASVGICLQADIVTTET